MLQGIGLLVIAIIYFTFNVFLENPTYIILLCRLKNVTYDIV